VSVEQLDQSTQAGDSPPIDTVDTSTDEQPTTVRKSRKIAKRKRIAKVLELSRGAFPMKPSAIAAIVGISPGTVAEYQKKFRDAGLLYSPTVETNGVPVYLQNKKNFLALPVIQSFIEKCLKDKLDWKSHVNHLFVICFALRLNPEELAKNLDTTEKHYVTFEQKYHEAYPERTDERHRKAIRKFCTYNNILIPDNNRAIPGTTDSHGDYSRVFLTDTEIDGAFEFIEKEYGLEWATIFGLHNETFMRPATLWKYIPKIDFQYVEVDGQTYEYGITQVYENKQAKLYDKLIIDPRVITMVKNLPSKPIVDLPHKEWEEKYSKILKSYYYKIGKLFESEKYKKGTDGWLYFHRPIYAIRHSSAVMWMQRTNFNAQLVSKMGWEDPKTLDKYYARSTVPQLMQMGICWWHNSPKQRLGRAIFCSPMHALAFMATEYQKKVGTIA
jgi:hypothetical protein